MRDLSREERTEQHISKLEKRIWEMAEDGRKNKWMRIRFSFYVLSVLFIALGEDGIRGIGVLLDLLVSTPFGWLIFAPLLAAVVMFVSYLVLAYIINGVIKDAFAIGEMEGRKAAMELSKLNKE